MRMKGKENTYQLDISSYSKIMKDVNKRFIKIILPLLPSSTVKGSSNTAARDRETKENNTAKTNRKHTTKRQKYNTTKKQNHHTTKRQKDHATKRQKYNTTKRQNHQKTKTPHHQNSVRKRNTCLQNGQGSQFAHWICKTLLHASLNLIRILYLDLLYIIYIHILVDFNQ